MYSHDAHVRHAAVGLVMAAVLAACIDEQGPTGPIRAVDPQFGAGDVLMVTNTSGGTGIGSLRWAMSHATGGEVIRFDPSLAGKTIVLDTTLVSNRHVTIEGPANGGVTISVGGNGGVLEMHAGTLDTTRLRNLTISGGNKPGGIGAGIYAPQTAVLVENSTITGNAANQFPAVFGQYVTLINSTVSGNTSALLSSGYAIFANTLTITSSTVAHNLVAGVVASQLVLRNAVLANNKPGKNCVANAFVREGTNISDDDTCGSPFVMLIADPLLGPLTDNGGPGRTHALTPGSPAINAGTSCSVNVDQRYVARDAECDPGAFEFTDFTTVELTLSERAMINVSNGWAVVTGTVRCSRNENFELRVELQQTQKVGKTTTDVQAAASTPVTCGTSAQSWSIALGATGQSFDSGSAFASVATVNTRAGVTSASTSGSIRLLKSLR